MVVNLSELHKKLKLKSRTGAAIMGFSCLFGPWGRAADWVVYPGGTGPGAGKQIVFLAGDEEYRSEEGLPMLAKILAVRHGFKCTVLFPINPAEGTIDPTTLTNIPQDVLDPTNTEALQKFYRARLLK